MHLRKARNSDVFAIRNLINEMAARTDSDFKHGHMLARSLAELFEHVRDYTVLVDEQDDVFGCCALESQWDGLAELKALAVHDSLQGQGWGRKLVEQVLSESDTIGLDCVYTLTNKPQVFERLGFVPIDMRELPQRVWNECTRCPKFMVACDEVAMTYRGCKPKPTFIPTVGAQAPVAVQQIAQQLQQHSGANGQIVSTTTPDPAHASSPMKSDGVLPPFNPDLKNA
jgi:amino-acid N-acetyltransferase